MAEIDGIGIGGCHYQAGVTCSAGSRDCEKCGFNPDSETRKRRVELAMQEYKRKVASGEVVPSLW